jgi:hypothetical protein
LTTSFNQICVLFDAFHEFYALQQKQFTPTQLAHWCSAVSGGITVGGVAAGSDNVKGKKTPTNSASKSSNNSRSKQSNAESANAMPPANSVLNIIRRASLIERMITAEYDAHLLAWGELQAALHIAAKHSADSNSVAAASFELTRASKNQQSLNDNTPMNPSLLAGWLSMDVVRVFDTWKIRHANTISHTHLTEEFQLIQGITVRALTNSNIWKEESNDQTDISMEEEDR